MALPYFGKHALDFLGVVFRVKERRSGSRLPHFGADGLPVGNVVAQSDRDVLVLLCGK